MNFTDLNFLTKLSGFVQVTAITLILFGGLLQASRFYIDKKINSIKADIAKTEKLQFEEKVGTLKSTISHQTEKIELQQKQLQEVETKTAPRNVPIDKLSILRNELSKYKREKIGIVCVMGDQEAFNFASELKDLFQSAGWQVDGVDQAIYTKPIKGLILVLKNEGVKPKAEYLFHILNSAGFHSTGEMNSQIKNDFGLVVGAKK